MTGFLRCSSALGLSALILMGTLNPGTASAETPTPTPAPSSSTSYELDKDKYSLTVSPTRLVVAPENIGTTQKLMLVNRGQAPLAVTMEKRNFTTNNDGSLNYSDDAPYAAADWMLVSPAQFTIAPGATQVVTADITMPAKPDLGDHQVALVFMVPAGQSSKNIKINRGVGSPVYITVPGPTDDSTTINSLTGPKFSRGGSLDINASIQNSGTVHRDFRGPNALKLASDGDTAFPDFTVSRGATRDVTAVWKAPFVCICYPTVAIDNASGIVSTATLRVIVFPWHLLLGAFVAVGVVVALMRLGRRSFRAQVAKAAAQQTTMGGP